MSWLLARLYDPFMRATEEQALGGWRRELLAGLGGAVLELGAGTGANLAHYPPAVERLVLSEPDRHMRRYLRERVRAAAPRARVVTARCEALPFGPDTFDAVVSTLVLCSVVDLERALSEAWRVLRPGGALVFVEHVAAEGRPGRLRLQRLLQPVWRRMAGNCHLVRRTADAIAAAGFDLTGEACLLRRESLRKALPWVRPTVRGIARKPDVRSGASGR